VRVYHGVLGATWVSIAGFFLFWGLDYYRLPLEERIYDPGHALFRPTGLVGNRLAILGTSLITIGVSSYMIRKRWKRLQGLGKLRHWLSFHIWCATLGPFLVMLHTSFKVGGIVSIAFWSMVLVVSSGVIGRYVYVRIPKTLNGKFHSMQEIEDEQRALLDEAERTVPGLAVNSLSAYLGEERTPRNLIHALILAVRFDFEGRRMQRRLRKTLDEAGVSAEVQATLVDLARRHRRLAQQRALLHPFARLFRYWHTFHLPLAIVMAIILLIHIGVAIAFGYAWTPS